MGCAPVARDMLRNLAAEPRIEGPPVPTSPWLQLIDDYVVLTPP